MFLFIIVLFPTIPSVLGWDLSYHNISSNYYVSSIAVYVNRAFLALPRSSCHNNVTNPTMVEASWYNEQQVFQKKNSFFLESQIWDTCDHLQDAISLDMEPLRPRLWVLDRGSPNCPPKIVVYNLFQKINYSLNAPEDTGDNKLSYLLVDNDVRNGARGYVGLDGADYLLIFSLNEFKWWRIHLETSNNLFPISTKFLAIGRRDTVLYITGGSERAMFSVDLKELIKDAAEYVNVTFLGEKLGNSSGLVADFKDGLSYYIPRDYVVLRWNTRKPSVAEHYNVLAQSYELLPYVSQLFTGPQNGIWALVNLNAPHECSEAAPDLQRRLIKILKYNIFI